MFASVVAVLTEFVAAWSSLLLRALSALEHAVQMNSHNMKDRKPGDRIRSILRKNGRTLFKFLSVFVAGVIFGTIIKGQSNNNSRSNPIRGSVLHLEDLPFKSTSHAGISKKQFIEPFAVPNLSGFQVATLPAGQSVQSHEHKTMHEIFYVISGKAIFTVNAVDHEAKTGTMIHLAPHERHSILALECPDGDLVIAYFGITI